MNKQNTIDRFIRYTKIDTQSNPASETYPSTAKQLDLLNLLCEEIKEMGVEASIDEHGYVFAKIPSNIDTKVPTVGFIAHADTAPDYSGTNVNAQIIENYDGGDIILNEKEKLSPADFDSLNNYVGDTLITTDGTTLLGADDKAGITTIMETIKYFVENPEQKHGELRFGFTPDEEVGAGTTYFDVEKFDADFAFTIDGGQLGELEYENFNAAGAKVVIEGRSVHPGTAKGQMINASVLVHEIMKRLPEQRPETTEGYEGFIHVTGIQSTCENASMDMIIREHDSEKFASYKVLIKEIVEEVNALYPKAKIDLTITDQYFNMKEKVEEMPEIMEFAKLGFERAGVEAKVQPIRGGTDGSNLSFKGLPTPNIFTGGHNFHGRYEYISVESMLKAQDVVRNIITVIGEK